MAKKLLCDVTCPRKVRRFANWDCGTTKKDNEYQYPDWIPKKPETKTKVKEKPMFNCESCFNYTKHEGTQMDDRSGKTAVMHCNNSHCYDFKSDILPCKRYKPGEIINPNSKEKPMLKKVLHLYRMAGMLWLTYGHYIVMAWLTPWLVKVVNLGLGILPDVEKVVDGEYVMMPIQLHEGIRGILEAWILAACAIAAVCVFTYLWSKATKFWYNEK